MSYDESSKAEGWRAEGRQEGRNAVLEAVKARLAAVDSLEEQLTALETAREADRIRAEKRLERETSILTQEIAIRESRFAEHRQQFEADFDKRVEGIVASRIRTISEDKEYDMAILNRQIASLTFQLSAVEAVREKQTQEIAAIRASFEQSVTQRLEDAVSVRISKLEVTKEQEISQLRTQIAMARSLEQMLAMANESLALMRSKMTALESSNASLQSQLSQYTETKSSHAIGAEGEATVLSLIETHVLPAFMYSSVTDTSKQSHSADCHIRATSAVGKKMKILVDSKKYKDPVRTKEITKLHDDVDADDEATAGIMVSLNSPIATVKQFQIEKTPKGKPILYLTMDNISNEYMGRVLSWGVRILSSLAYESSHDQMEKLSGFLKDLDSSLKDADQTVKACNKALESAKTMKANLSKSITDFRMDESEGSEATPPIAKKTRAKRKNPMEPKVPVI